MDLPTVEMNVFETILARRSVQSYQSRKVDPKIINIILEAANCAPLTNQCDPCAYIIIQDKALLLSLSDETLPIITTKFNRHFIGNKQQVIAAFNLIESNILLEANTLILIGGKTKEPSHVADCWLAAGNLMLAACALGLGASVVDQSMITFDLNGVKNKLGIPSDFTVIAPIVVGYSENVIAQVIRDKPKVISWLKAL